jgi:hypothetical protein
MPTTELRNQIVADAQSLPDLIKRAEVLDPQLADTLKGQASTASATPLGAFVAAGIAWLVTHYGLGWDQSSVDLVAGLAIVAGGYAAHYAQAFIQKKPALAAPSTS